MKAEDTWTAEGTFVSEALHALSQPLTALECGLELSLRQDKTIADMRNRMESLRETAQALHQRLMELRALQDAGDAGDMRVPVALGGLLEQLQEDFAPVAELSQVMLAIRWRPAQVLGNAARLRNGFFHLVEFLMRHSPSGGSVTISGRRASAATVELTFCARGGPDGVRGRAAASARDLDWRLAGRAFAAAGGRMEMLPTDSGSVAGVVTLRTVAEAEES